MQPKGPACRSVGPKRGRMVPDEPAAQWSGRRMAVRVRPGSAAEIRPGLRSELGRARPSRLSPAADRGKASTWVPQLVGRRGRRIRASNCGDGRQAVSRACDYTSGERCGRCSCRSGGVQGGDPGRRGEPAGPKNALLGGAELGGLGDRAGRPDEGDGVDASEFAGQVRPGGRCAARRPGCAAGPAGTAARGRGCGVRGGGRPAAAPGWISGRGSRVRPRAGSCSPARRPRRRGRGRR